MKLTVLFALFATAAAFAPSAHVPVRRGALQATPDFTEDFGGDTLVGSGLKPKPLRRNPVVDEECAVDSRSPECIDFDYSVEQGVKQTLLGEGLLDGAASFFSAVANQAKESWAEAEKKLGDGAPRP